MDLVGSIRMWRLIAMEAIANSQHQSQDVKDASIMLRDYALNIAQSMEQVMAITQCTCENCVPVKH